jgi:hypothetical protein
MVTLIVPTLSKSQASTTRLSIFPFVLEGAKLMTCFKSDSTLEVTM